MYKAGTSKATTDPDSTKSNWMRWVPDPLKSPQHTTKKTTEENAKENTKPANPLLDKNVKAAINNALKNAREQGHAEGYKAGYDEGRKAGETDGYEQGYKTGHAKGLQEGHESGADQARQAAQALDDLAQKCAQALLGIEADMGQSIIKLAVRIAEQVVHSTIQAQPAKILALIGDMVNLNPSEAKALTLYVNPQDLELVKKYLSSNPDTALWRAFSDDTITRGGCRASTALGDIDATIEQRWRRVVATLGEL